MTTPIPEWEKEFDYAFKGTIIVDRDKTHSGYEGRDFIKDFIRSLLLSQRQSLIEKVAGMKRGIVNTSSNVLTDSIYNQAISDVLSILKETNNLR